MNARYVYGLWLVACGGFLLLALALRLKGAQGDLWLDEIWTLELLSQIDHGWQVFTGIHHDNNHHLNSLWLWLAGPDASILQMRSLSIAFGVASVAMAGLVAKPYGKPGILAAMLLFAVTYPMMHFTSEARGYAGLIFFCLLAIRLVDVAGIARPSRHERYRLAAVALLGMLSHLTMLAPLAMLGLWACWRQWRMKHDLRAGFRQAMDYFAPARLAVIVFLLLLILIPVMQDSAFTVGGRNPFTFSLFFTGYGDLIRYLLGAPGILPDWGYIAGLWLTFGLYAWWQRNNSESRWRLHLLLIVILPLLMALARLPNLEFSRYYLASGIGILLWLTEAFAMGWRSRPIIRPAVILLLAAILLGNAVSLHAFYALGRGEGEAPVHYMAEAGGEPIVYSQFLMEGKPDFIGWHADRLSIGATYIPREDWCDNPPDWFIAPDITTDDFPEDATIGPEACPLRFIRVRLYRYHAFSGWHLAIYRRE